MKSLAYPWLHHWKRKMLPENVHTEPITPRSEAYQTKTSSSMMSLRRTANWRQWFGQCRTRRSRDLAQSFWNNPGSHAKHHWCSTSNGYKILNQKVVIEGMFVKICQQGLCDIICCEKYVVWLCISSSCLQTDPKKRFTSDSINILNFHSFLMMSRPLILQRATGYTPLTCWTHQVAYLPVHADTVGRLLPVSNI